MSNRSVYMDHAATSPLREEVLEEMLPFLREKYGNPSTIYSAGREAKKAIEKAREQAALALGAMPEEIYFTSGGTESNNIALGGIMKSRGRKGHLITSAVEHHAVLDVCKELAGEGYGLTIVPVDGYGMVNIEDLKNAVTDHTVLISVMTANNEMGTIQPVQEIGKLARERDILFHTDAVQAVGQIPLDVKALNVDLLSLSAHKFNGPKGVGALFIRKGTKVSPPFFGGSQERKIRPGTENVAGIVGLGKAVELASSEIPEKAEALSNLRDLLTRGLLSMEDVVLNGHPVQRLPGNINVSIKYIEGESLLLSLDLEGVAASSGSACTSGSLDPSHVLTAMGMDHHTAHGSIRFSLGKGNNREDVEYVLNILPGIVERLRNMSSTYHRNR